MTAEKTVSENVYSITDDELLAIGLTLNDGIERGWLRTLAMLLKKTRQWCQSGKRKFTAFPMMMFSICACWSCSKRRASCRQA